VSSEAYTKCNQWLTHPARPSTRQRDAAARGSRIGGTRAGGRPLGTARQKKESARSCRLFRRPSVGLPDALPPDTLSEQRHERHDPSEIREHDVLHHGATSSHSVFSGLRLNGHLLSLLPTVSLGSALSQAVDHRAAPWRESSNCFFCNRLISPDCGRGRVAPRRAPA
jgi:hypothetical protein